MTPLIRTYDRDLLAHKIKWEGGVLAALDYGLRPEDIRDEDLRTAWTQLQLMHQRIKPLVRRFEDLLKS
jgi:hypothetical protein